MCKENLEHGLHHVLSPDGYDHLLFLIALFVAFAITDWKKILLVLAAFTIGHGLTLLLAALDITSFSHYWIAIFIPFTILMASIQNLVRLSDKSQNRVSVFPLALSFGFIHGLGVSNDLTSLLGREADIIMPLFAFNLGIEIGQLCIIIVFMGIGYVLTGPGRIKQKYWILGLSLLTAVLSAYLIYEHL